MSPRLTNSRTTDAPGYKRSPVSNRPHNGYQMAPVGSKIAARVDGTQRATPPQIDACVLFSNLPRDCGLPAVDRRAIRKYASQLNLDVASGRGFDCLVTNDGRLRALNNQFRGRDYPTDVLSFPSGASRGAAGEIAISMERAAAQAHEFGHSTAVEIQILMLHGVLHLMGHDHEQDRGEMRRLERTWRLAYDLPSGLIGRRASRAAGRPKASAAATGLKPRSDRLPL
jgi:probable rRNA maturation factor